MPSKKVPGDFSQSKNKQASKQAKPQEASLFVSSMHVMAVFVLKYKWWTNKWNIRGSRKKNELQIYNS